MGRKSSSEEKGVRDSEFLPPVNFLKRRLPIEKLKTGVELFRIHRAIREPLWFGPGEGNGPTNRFDDTNGNFRICYFGCSQEAAFAETFLRRPPVSILSRSMANDRCITRCIVKRNISLVPLYGSGLAKIGATSSIVSGRYRVSREWSRIIWDHPQKPDGLIYRCRHDDDQLAVALFDRSKSAVVMKDTVGLRDDLLLFGRLLNRYELALDD